MYIDYKVLSGKVPVDQEQLQYLVNYDFNYNLSKLDTSKITHLSDIEKLFYCISRQNLSRWDVSNVVDIGKVHEENKFRSDYEHPYEYFKVFQDTFFSMLKGEIPVDETLLRYLASNHNKYNLTNLDTSRITDMSDLFDHKFNQDISNWDVSRVKTMQSMFQEYKDPNVPWRDRLPTLDRASRGITPASFNHDISNWDVTCVTDICEFKSKKFLNGIHPYEYFKVFKNFITDKVLEGKLPVDDIQLRYLIYNHEKYDLTNLDTSQIQYMGQLFSDISEFSQDIRNWDVRNIKDLFRIFNGSRYRGINPFEVFNLFKNKNFINEKVLDGKIPVDQIQFQYLAYNHNDFDITNLDTSKITDMRGLFSDSQFNQDISNWDVSSVTDMLSMFSYSQFNQDISNWDVRNVITTQNMFYKSKFNQDISKWDLANCIVGAEMFFDSAMNYSGESYKYFKIKPARNVENNEDMVWF